MKMVRRVVAFNGSPKRDGHTADLLDVLLTELQKSGVESETVQIGGTAMQGCTACMDCRTQDRCSLKGDELNLWIDKMIDADGIVIGTPTYYADVTPEVKAFIDRVGFVMWNNGNLLKRKVGAAAVTVRRSGAIRAYETINNFFLINEMMVPGSTYWNMGFSSYDGDVRDDIEGVNSIRNLGQNMAWLLDRICDS